MDRFEEKQMNTKTITKNTWYDWYDLLTNYIPESIKNPWVVLKNLF